MTVHDRPHDRDAERSRAAMVDELRRRGIDDERVLGAMAAVPRELFVDPDLADEAYADAPMAIGSGQTISTPWIVAFSAAALSLPDRARVLEVGTGSGYGAAVLAACGASVLTVERHPELAERARRTLDDAGYGDVRVRTGDGMAGAPLDAPFDGIVVTAMAQHQLPAALIEQLAPDGVLVCPIGDGGDGELVRHRHGETEGLVPVRFVPLVPGAPPSRT
ncbi:protein-L-isoaspartate(D-aspartate) O-methyltransferase [Pseudonocardia sp. KRD291]|uniref:protein-L-isoaspartate(D-aspartate) O-methyltransferase n=1 Tax=Pseudonocardia sp. KRD291 TaxID=2792007 RepID=UPI001C4A30A9|nr:protein-L-isoaspartate(D-aspartate) O-methyltransferase [Pseudonocardia sp. KRD291]MBW0104082.1 protein-L-isoaspartate(D-aspartate) O-methyltransferase [Pseudonocardia sp. KRD291]